MNRNRAAHFAAAYALFRMAADYADHWGQSDFDAQCKGATDDAPVTYKREDTGEETTVGTKGGRAACTATSSTTPPRKVSSSSQAPDFSVSASTPQPSPARSPSRA